MKGLTLNTVTLITLVLFVTALGVRRVVVRNQLKELGSTVERLRIQQGLQERIDKLVNLLVKSDASLRGIVIARNVEFVPDFETHLSTIDNSFEGFLHEAASQDILTPADSVRLDSLFTLKFSFIKEMKQLCDAAEFEKASTRIATGYGQMLADSISRIIHRGDQSLEIQIRETEAAYNRKSQTESLFALISFLGLAFLLICFLIMLYLQIKKNAVVMSDLADREEKLSVTLDGIADAVLTTDKFGKINYLNATAEKLLSSKLSEVDGTPLEQVVTFRDATTDAPIQDLVDGVVTSGLMVENETYIVTQSKIGNRFPAEVTAAPLQYPTGEVHGMVLILRDMTEKQLAREKLEKQYAALNQYAHINSHEVRAHVATMLGLMQLHIDRHLTSEETSHIITHLYDETTKLDQVVRKLTTLIDQEHNG